MGIVQPPRDSVQDTCDAILRDATTEQRIALKCSEGVILDFGVRWRRALPDKVEIDIGAKRWDVEQNEPYVYA